MPFVNLVSTNVFHRDFTGLAQFTLFPTKEALAELVGEEHKVEAVSFSAILAQTSRAVRKRSESTILGTTFCWSIPISLMCSVYEGPELRPV